MGGSGRDRRRSRVGTALAASATGAAGPSRAGRRYGRSGDAHHDQLRHGRGLWPLQLRRRCRPDAVRASGQCGLRLPRRRSQRDAAHGATGEASWREGRCASRLSGCPGIRPTRHGDGSRRGRRHGHLPGGRPQGLSRRRGAAAEPHQAAWRAVRCGHARPGRGGGHRQSGGAVRRAGAGPGGHAAGGGLWRTWPRLHSRILHRPRLQRRRQPHHHPGTSGEGSGRGGAPRRPGRPGRASDDDRRT